MITNSVYHYPLLCSRFPGPIVWNTTKDSSRKLLLTVQIFFANPPVMGMNVEAGIHTNWRNHLSDMKLVYQSRVEILCGLAAPGEQGAILTSLSFKKVVWNKSFSQQVSKQKLTLVTEVRWRQLICQMKGLIIWSWLKKEPEWGTKRATNGLKTGHACRLILGMELTFTAIACMQLQC